jgi:hypothetical protein
MTTGSRFEEGAASVDLDPKLEVKTRPTLEPVLG